VKAKKVEKEPKIKKKRGRPRKEAASEDKPKKHGRTKVILKSKHLSPKKEKIEKVKKVKKHKAECSEEKEKLPKYKGTKQIALVISMLREKPQTRDTLSKAIRKAGLGKDKSDKDIKNYISVMLTKLKTKYVIKSPKRGVYFIKRRKKEGEE
jgi:hypothetical protein